MRYFLKMFLGKYNVYVNIIYLNSLLEIHFHDVKFYVIDFGM